MEGTTTAVGEARRPEEGGAAVTVESTTSTNGLTMSNNKVTTLQVFLFNSNALPNSGGNVIPGTVIDPHGPLVSVLTD